jgi:hypothetical protein
VVPLISFVAALQNTSFDGVGPWPFNSPTTTGNLRDATSGSVLWSAGRETAANRSEAITLSLICFSFLVGAPCGGIFTRLHFNGCPCDLCPHRGYGISFDVLGANKGGARICGRNDDALTCASNTETLLWATSAEGYLFAASEGTPAGICSGVKGEFSNITGSIRPAGNLSKLIGRLCRLHGG